jgi:hypothetical protein
MLGLWEESHIRKLLAGAVADDKAGAHFLDRPGWAGSGVRGTLPRA